MFALILNTRVQIPIRILHFTNISLSPNWQVYTNLGMQIKVWHIWLVTHLIDLPKIHLSIHVNKFNFRKTHISAHINFNHWCVFCLSYVLRLRFISIGKIKARWTAFFFLYSELNKLHKVSLISPHSNSIFK